MIIAARFSTFACPSPSNFSLICSYRICSRPLYSWLRTISPAWQSRADIITTASNERTVISHERVLLTRASCNYDFPMRSRSANVNHFLGLYLPLKSILSVINPATRVSRRLDSPSYRKNLYGSAGQRNPSVERSVCRPLLTVSTETTALSLCVGVRHNIRQVRNLSRSMPLEGGV